MSNATDAINYLIRNGTCKRLNETADPDVTGLGVVSSFLVSITFSLFAIAAAYFCRWLPDERFSPIDDALSGYIQSFLPWPRPSHHGQHGWPRRRGAQNRKLMRRKRVKAFESFILAMSDQQLITGFALVITTTFMTFRDDLSDSFSVYSFQIATRLGYFSCIVHFCTISLVRERFDASRFMRNVRSALVAVLLVLLVVCMVISESVTFRFNHPISVKCARENFHFIDPKRPGYTKFSDEVVVIANLVVLILVILLGYLRRCLEPYHADARGDYHYWPRKSLIVWFGEDGEAAYNTVSPGISSLLRSLREYDRGSRDYWACFLEVWVESISASLFWDIIWLSFYFTFGMGNFWNFYTDAEVKHEFDPNFGQVVPLILVCLPFLSAWEAFSGIYIGNRRPVFETQRAEPNPSSSGIQLNGDTSEVPSGDEDDDPLLGNGHPQTNTNMPAGTMRAADGILEVARDHQVSLRWFQVCPFLYWVGLMVWALMFAGVIPGYGAFYVTIVACVIFAGFAVAGAAACCKAFYRVLSTRR
ncbi:hypothetical protein CMUS01_07921 [Colletotrichum musicola]|uniref:Uncharacterized protein n=1 Tax=Colletotrichum musicola TaxID=2175873 RepID=A0A8H6NDZ5_9PEZI|nr:hypothetical protein CMUS01_07921 [Colletotrichum musicola]